MSSTLSMTCPVGLWAHVLRSHLRGLLRSVFGFAGKRGLPTLPPTTGVILLNPWRGPPSSRLQYLRGEFHPAGSTTAASVGLLASIVCDRVIRITIVEDDPSETSEPLEVEPSFRIGGKAQDPSVVVVRVRYNDISRATQAMCAMSWAVLQIAAKEIVDSPRGQGCCS